MYYSRNSPYENLHFGLVQKRPELCQCYDVDTKPFGVRIQSTLINNYWRTLSEILETLRKDDVT